MPPRLRSGHSVAEGSEASERALSQPGATPTQGRGGGRGKERGRVEAVMLPSHLGK